MAAACFDPRQAKASTLFGSSLLGSMAPLAAVAAVRAGHAGRRADAPKRRNESENGKKFLHRGSSVERPGTITARSAAGFATHR